MKDTPKCTCFDCICKNSPKIDNINYNTFSDIPVAELQDFSKTSNIQLFSITPNAEELIENIGRVCYQSKPSENYKSGTLIKTLIKNGHESVLEHAIATFKISGVSRALTHQLVRHRLCSFTQKSQRYVNEYQFNYIIPTSITSKDDIEDFKDDMYKIQMMYDKWKKKGLKNEDARYVLPNACATEIVISANMREWRSIFNSRCTKHAQWEIRELCLKLLEILYSKCPNIFEDLYLEYKI